MTKKIMRRVRTDPNSYMYEVKFDSEVFELIVKTLIDQIIFTNVKPDFKSIDRQLKRDCSVNKDERISDNRFQRRREYKFQNSRIALMYQPKRSTNNFVPNSFLIRLYQPTRKSIDIVSNILSKLSGEPKVSKIELAWDFYGTSSFYLKEIFVRHLFLKYSRQSPRFYEDSYYTNNLRQSVKGVRLYPKGENDNQFLRLELELHRQKLRQLGLSYYIEIEKLVLDYTNHFEFKRIDFDRLQKYLYNLLRSDYDRNDKYGSLYYSYIDSWIAGWMGMPLMEAVMDMRKLDWLKNPSRFFISMDALNEIIRHSVFSQKFGLA